jgi:hypothetical protein
MNTNILRTTGDSLGSDNCISADDSLLPHTALVAVPLLACLADGWSSISSISAWYATFLLEWGDGGAMDGMLSD